MWSVLEFQGLYDLLLQWEYLLLQTVKGNAINNRTRPLGLNWNCLKQIGTYGHLLKWKLSLRSRVNSSSSPENYLCGRKKSLQTEAGGKWAPGWTAGVWPYGQILQDEEEEGLSPAQGWAHISHSQGQGDLPDYTCTERLLEGQKGRGRHPIVGDVKLPIGLFAGIHLG